MKKAEFYRKINSIKQMVEGFWSEGYENYVIEKEIELTENEYDKFINEFLYDQKFIKENKNLMWMDNMGRHCIAISSKKRKWKILVESEGSDYARYVARVRK